MASVTMAGGYGGGRYDQDDDNYDREEPRFEDRGDSLRAQLEIENLRYDRNVQIEIEAHAEVEVECVRYRGRSGNYRRVERDVDVLVSGDRTISRRFIRRGDLNTWVETADIADELEDRYDNYNDYSELRDICPNNYRLDRVRSVMFSDAKIEVEQGNREVVTWLCSFDRDTRNGTVPRGQVDCTRLYGR